MCILKIIVFFIIAFFTSVASVSSENLGKLIFSKLCPQEEVLLKFIEDEERESCYYGFLDNPLFGSYMLTDAGQRNQPLGFIKIFPQEYDDFVVAEMIIDVYFSERGKGHGTKLGQKLIAKVAKSIGKDVYVSEDRTRLSKEPLAFIYCQSEWDWGENGSSLKSAYKAGFRVFSVGRSVVHMLYPPTEHCFSERETNFLLDFSLSFSHYSKDISTYYYDDKKKPLDKIKSILKLLDLSQENHMATFFVLLDFVVKNFPGQSKDIEESAVNLVLFLPEKKKEIFLKVLKNPREIFTYDFPKSLVSEDIEFSLSTFKEVLQHISRR